jgi:hypothetical protein
MDGWIHLDLTLGSDSRLVNKIIGLHNKKRVGIVLKYIYVISKYLKKLANIYYPKITTSNGMKSRK